MSEPIDMVGIGAPSLGKQRMSKRTIRGLDPKIRAAVVLLDRAGIETYESCQGGKGHVYPEPTVRFHGDRAEGWRALSVVLYYGADRKLGRLRALRRAWRIMDGEPEAPHWELTWWPDE